MAFFEVQDWERKFIQNGLKNQELLLNNEALDQQSIQKIQDTEILSVFIYSNITRNLIEQLPNLSLISTRSTGYDHIDIATAKEKGIQVCNVPLYAETTVAEHTFALILSLSRKIHDYYERTRQGDFTCRGVSGFDLAGKVLGVLGTDRIGRKVIEIAKGFGMHVLAFDSFPNHALADSLGFKYEKAEKVLSEADVLTLHLPLNDETRHFINEDTISKMKKTAIIINTARGGLIDSQALTEALVEARLGGAGLDVLEEETLIREEAELLLDDVPREKLATMLREHILLRLDNVIITPHCAFNSRESLERLINGTISNIHGFIDGKPQNIING
ncbi:MAG: hydroxyacid dehydrogenase [Candidatus Bathyarchaeota archaeon]|nr:hydroxyacid dehydrogenase [Candidatus Bathyarchaeota archaeon]